MNAMPLLAAALLLAPVCQAAVPASFTARAKEMLNTGVEIAPAEHTLNVVYFLGCDNQPVAGYERRLSELMLYVQQYYAAEMTRNGFPGRTFGLELLENGYVKLHLVRGKQPHRAYAYGSGHNACLADIAEYARQNPGALRSEHTLVIMPTFYDTEYSDKSPGGVPFYGLGRNCFALDYATFELCHLGKQTHEGRLLTKWLGGLAHELGHGLNLPHNEGTVTDKAAMGTPLMGAGNYTFGMLPTYLTQNSARLLDCCQVFAKAGDKTAYYAESPAPVVQASSLKWVGDSLHLTLTCTHCAYVNVLVQDPPYQVNQDYDAVAFCAASQPAADGACTYTLSIPLAELAARKNTATGEQAIDILLVQRNGNRYRWRTTFDWSTLKKGDLIPLSNPSGMWMGY